jgi:hypothetical protein
MCGSDGVRRVSSGRSVSDVELGGTGEEDEGWDGWRR